MNSGLSPGDPVLIAAFRSALLHQGVIALIMIVLLGLVWAAARAWPASTPGGNGGDGTVSDRAVSDRAVADRAVAAGNPEPRGRWLLAGLGVFFAGMAVLQAWPGRGSWQGTVPASTGLANTGLASTGRGKPGPLAGMVREMAATPQPHVLSSVLSGFASFVARHGFAVNLVVVLALAGLGALFLTGRPRLVRYAVWAGIIFCLATWVLVQDLGFLGGLGTDPNSMIPLILLFAAGYLALRPAPPGESPSGLRPPGAPEAVTAGWRAQLRPEALGWAVAAARWQGVAAAGALAVIMLGAAPMAAAAADRTADPILALAIAGDSSRLDLPAPGFSLTDQAGRTVSLDSLRGKVVLMTFLDPVCTSDCPVIAQELKQAGRMLGAQDARVELVAVVANPVYRSVAFTRAFDRQEGLAAVPNWLYLTGSLSQLRPVWRHYGVEVENLPAGAMAAHNDLAVVIDAAGHIRREMGADPGPATDGTTSSFAVLLSQYARDALGPA